MDLIVLIDVHVLRVIDFLVVVIVMELNVIKVSFHYYYYITNSSILTEIYRKNIEFSASLCYISFCEKRAKRVSKYRGNYLNPFPASTNRS